MSKHFFNLSNHPNRNAKGEQTWSAEQIEGARKIIEGQGHYFLGIEDVKHPNIPPRATTEEVNALAVATCEPIPDNSDVMCMGDFTFILCAIPHLKSRGCRVWLATTERTATETVKPDGSREMVHVFKFVTFRPAP